MNAQDPPDDPGSDGSPKLPESGKAPSASRGLASDLLHFLLHEKKWWLIPLLAILALAVLFVILFESPIAPFLYPTY
jgi:hypothetical protein